MISLFDSLCVSRPADADACAQVSPFRQVGFAANAKANLELIADLHDKRNRRDGRMDGMQHADLTNLPNGHSIDCGWNPSTDRSRSPMSPPTNFDRSIPGFMKPFNIYVHTNSAEGTTGTTNPAPADTGNVGFCLNYVQQPCTSTSG